MPEASNAGRADDLIGRAGELALVGRALAVAAGGTTARVRIEGAPGTGKTAVCRWTAASAEGFQTLLVTCIEGEGRLGLATLVTLLRPLRHLVGDLTGSQQAILQGVLDGTGSQADPVSLGAAALALVARAAERAPVLVVVDDEHWMDPPSAVALGFALRRLDADAVAVVVAARAVPPVVELGPVTLIPVGPLSAGEASDLARRVAPMEPVVADTIAREVGGLPLAVCQVAAHLDAAQRAGRRPLPEPLPVGDRLLAEFRRRLTALDEPARLAVAVAAAAGSRPADVGIALQRLEVDVAVLDRAEREQLVDIGRDGVTVPHPLIRTAALAAADGPTRRLVHRTLADVTADPERRAAHLVASAAGLSHQIAGQLEQAAAATAARSGSVAAAGIWADAAGLTPPGPERHLRQRRAIAELAAAGRVDDAVRVTEEVLATCDDPDIRLDVAVLSSWVRTFAGDLRAAADDALAEAARAMSYDPIRSTELRAVAGVCLMNLGLFDRALATVAVSPPATGIASTPPTVATTFPAHILALVGRLDEAEAWIPPERVAACLDRLATGRPDPPLLVGIQNVCVGLSWLGRHAECAELAEAAIARCVSDQQAQPLGFLRFLFGVSRLRQSRWDEAAAGLDEAIGLAEPTDLTSLTAIARVIRAELRAARGDFAGCADDCEEATRPVAGGTPTKAVEFFALSAAGLSGLAAGDAPAAVDALGRLAALARVTGFRNPIGVPFRPNLCEALIATGDLDGARSEFEVLCQEARTTGQGWAGAMARRVEGLLLDSDARRARLRPPRLVGDSIDAAFAASLAAWPDGFDGARTRLAWAESLIRRDGTDRAAGLLAEATAELARLGARPWEQRARHAIAAAGRPAPASAPAALTALTGQELQVALAVADGLRNREAAERLFMSSKTVEHHLSRVYAKLGLRSRSDLVRYVARSVPARTEPAAT